MACPSDRLQKTGAAGPDPALRGFWACSLGRALCLALVALLAAALSGCVSLQVQKARRGVDPVPLAGELAPGTASLQDVLSRCGAPDEIVDLDPDFALHYRRALQRGAKVSVGFPLKYTLMPNPSLETRGNLVRYDTLVLVFTGGGLLKDLRYEKATDRPMIEDYW